MTTVALVMTIVLCLACACGSRIAERLTDWLIPRRFNFVLAVPLEARRLVVCRHPAQLRQQRDHGAPRPAHPRAAPDQHASTFVAQDTLTMNGQEFIVVTSHRI